MESMNDDVRTRSLLTNRRMHVNRRSFGLPVSKMSSEIGMRTDEMALVAGLSESRYIDLENGHANEVSNEELSALAAVLDLNDKELTTLCTLSVELAPSRQRRDGRGTDSACDLSTRSRGSGDQTGAIAVDYCLNIVSCNQLGRLWFDPILSSNIAKFDGFANIALFMFLDDEARAFCNNWTAEISALVTSLRFEARNRPFDRSVRKLISRLTQFSNEFRNRWSGHDSGAPTEGKTCVNHPSVGLIELTWRTLRLFDANPTEGRVTNIILCDPQGNPINPRRLSDCAE